MMSKRISAIILLLVIFSVPIYTFAANINKLPLIVSSGTGDIIHNTEQFFLQNFPYREKLKNLAINAQILSGKSESNNIYISKNILMENIKPPQLNYTTSNTQNIINFIEENKVQTYFMLVPTACAIKRQELPRFAVPYNQKKYIDNIYKELTGKASSIDVYSTLFANKEKYIYYKTQSDLTSLGGYYVYSVLGKRLGLSTRSLEQYDIEYVDYNLYGDLYKNSPYQKISPDLMSLYHFSKYRREYKILHYNEDEVKSYYTLYPTHLIKSKEPMDIYMGGFSAVMDITVASSYTEKILIFADKSAISYLPFLVNHYARVTIVDLSQATQEMLAKIELDDYGQILFSYETDTFMNSNETKALVNITD